MTYDQLETLHGFLSGPGLKCQSRYHRTNCQTDGSKLDDDKTGASVLINNSQNDTAEKASHLGTNATEF